LRPGQRDVLIDLFDRELVESQEAAGMAIVGQFRDLDDPDRFVWIRGFSSMPARARALASFYGGPVWKAHSAPANATTIDRDDVPLLRPVLLEARAMPLACLQTAHAENTFPALPVRTGENVFVWLARFPSPDRLRGHLQQIERCDAWRDRVLPALSAMIAGAPQRLRLA